MSSPHLDDPTEQFP